MNTKFEVGNIVNLKSGSINMTITHLFDSNAEVTWWSMINGFDSQVFPLEAIEISPAEDDEEYSSCMNTSGSLDFLHGN